MSRFTGAVLALLVATLCGACATPGHGERRLAAMEKAESVGVIGPQRRLGAVMTLPKTGAPWRILEDRPTEFTAGSRLVRDHTAAVQVFRTYPWADQNAQHPEAMKMIDRYMRFAGAGETVEAIDVSRGTGRLAPCIRFHRASLVTDPERAQPWRYVRYGLTCTHPADPGFEMEVVYSERMMRSSTAVDDAQARADRFFESFAFQSAPLTLPPAEPGFIGAELIEDPSSDFVEVLSLVKGRGAERAGLQPKDRLQSVDGVSVLGWPLKEVIARLRGDAGKPVQVTVLRPSTKAELAVKVYRLPSGHRFY